jgi:hypothetical protein
MQGTTHHSPGWQGICTWQGMHRTAGGSKVQQLAGMCCMQAAWPRCVAPAGPCCRPGGWPWQGWQRKGSAQQLLPPCLPSPAAACQSAAEAWSITPLCRLVPLWVPTPHATGHWVGMVMHPLLQPACRSSHTANHLLLTTGCHRDTPGCRYSSCVCQPLAVHTHSWGVAYQATPDAWQLPQELVAAAAMAAAAAAADMPQVGSLAVEPGACRLPAAHGPAQKVVQATVRQQASTHGCNQRQEPTWHGRNQLHQPAIAPAAATCLNCHRHAACCTPHVTRSHMSPVCSWVPAPPHMHTPHTMKLLQEEW